MVFPYIMHMRLTHETSLFYGKPPGRSPNLDLVRDISQHDAPSIDPRGMGALEGQDTTLGVLDRLKEEKHGWDRNLITYTFGMGDVKKKGSHMTDVLCDRSSVLSLRKIVPYWKSHCWWIIPRIFSHA